MATTDRARDRGRRQGQRAFRDIGRELRDARLAAGLSQRRVALVAGIAQAQISRTERAARRAPRLDELAVHAAALGLRLSIKAYPDGSPVRDEAQLQLLERFRARLGPGYRWRAEAPVGGDGDLRAWDVRLDGPISIGVDAETRLTDVQALTRRFELKRRDSGVERIVLLVARSRHDRRVLALHREALRSTFPADTAEILAPLRRGHAPASDGIVVL